jgi:hypothetical protein
MNAPKPLAHSDAALDEEVQDILTRYRCPTALHALRTLMLGHIASPGLEVSPMAPLLQAWGGELPVFGSAEEMDDVMSVLMYGLWNRLSEHQSSRKPFKLTRFEVTVSQQALHGLAEMRAQELKGFVDGLLGADDEMVLPQKAHDAVVALAQLYEMFVGASELLADPAQLAPDQELKALLQNFQRMTIVADEQINKAVQSCKRARLSSGQHGEKTAAMMSRKFAAATAPYDDKQGAREDDAESELYFMNSPLSQTVTRNGVTVDVEIYGDGHGGWILEIVDAENASHVWDEPFETEQQALTEALRALDEAPLEFLGRTGDQPLN